MLKFHGILNELGIKNIYSLSGVHADKNNNMAGVYTDNNLLIPLEKQKFDEKYGLSKISEGSIDDIDMILNTEVDIIDIRIMNVSFLEHKASLYNGHFQIFTFSINEEKGKND